MGNSNFGEILAMAALGDTRGTPTVSANETLAGILAGTSQYFYIESGDGSSAHRYVIKPRIGVANANVIHVFTVTEPPSDIYIGLCSSGTQRVILSIVVPAKTGWVHHIHFNVYDHNGNPRLRYAAGTSTWVTTPFDTTATAAYRVITDVNDDAPYRSVFD